MEKGRHLFTPLDKLWLLLDYFDENNALSNTNFFLTKSYIESGAQLGFVTAWASNNNCAPKRNYESQVSF